MKRLLYILCVLSLFSCSGKEKTEEKFDYSDLFSGYAWESFEFLKNGNWVAQSESAKTTIIFYNDKEYAYMFNEYGYDSSWTKTGNYTAIMAEKGIILTLGNYDKIGYVSFSSDNSVFEFDDVKYRKISSATNYKK